MNEEQEPIDRQVPLPPELYNSETKKPLDHCLMCDLYLLEEGTPYMIEKSIKQHPELGLKETIFEYAMCMTCAMKMNDSLSEESRQRIGEYFARHANFPERSKSFADQNTFDLDSWTARCIIKDTPIVESSEYQIVAQCDGTHLLFTGMPFAISFAAMEEMSALMSAKSLGEMDDFIGKYFTGPPEVAELLKKKFILV